MTKSISVRDVINEYEGLGEGSVWAGRDCIFCINNGSAYYQDYSSTLRGSWVFLGQHFHREWLSDMSPLTNDFLYTVFIKRTQPKYHQRDSIGEQGDSAWEVLAVCNGISEALTFVESTRAPLVYHRIESKRVNSGFDLEPERVEYRSNQNFMSQRSSVYTEYDKEYMDVISDIKRNDSSAKNFILKGNRVHYTKDYCTLSNGFSGEREDFVIIE